MISTAFDILKAGVMDPEFFELLPLFQENVGADRLSDMIATLILDDIKEFTRRVNRELGINHNRYKKLFFSILITCLMKCHKKIGKSIVH